MKDITEYTHHSELPETENALIVAPNFMALLTGATMASQSKNGDITLVYTDGTSETVPGVSATPYICDFDTFPQIVGYVQSFRP